MYMEMMPLPFPLLPVPMPTEKYSMNQLLSIADFIYSTKHIAKSESARRFSLPPGPLFRIFVV